jgi:hypothetical protein
MRISAWTNTLTCEIGAAEIKQTPAALILLMAQLDIGQVEPLLLSGIQYGQTTL